MLGLCFSAVLALLASSPAPAGEFTPEQRQAIEAIIRDYLSKNPEMLLDVLQAAEDKLKGEAHDKASATLAARRHDVFDDPDAPIGGNPQGNVSLVEFFDYRCPYCKQMEPTIQALIKEDGKLRIVYKEFPILGPVSVYASRVAIASRKQGKYEEFRSQMIAAKGNIDQETVLKTAAASGLDLDKLKTDMAAPDVDKIIQRNFALAEALNIDGTPGLVVGNVVIEGAADLDEMRKRIAAARKGG